MKNAIQHNATTASTNVWVRRLRHTMGSLGALLLLGTSALAQNPTGPFSGQYTEDFESSLSLASGYAPTPVFQGNATYHTSWAIQSNTSWTYGCSISSYGGSNFVGDTGGLMWFNFNAAPSRFGGYFGSNQPGVPITVNVRFLDMGNAVLATDVVTLQNNCTWQWLGWDFPLSNIYRIEFETTPGLGFLMMDDLELDPGIIICNPPGSVTFCFGDGSGTPCPCGNTGAPGHGCANGANPNGGLLCMTGTGSISASNASLIASEVVPNRWVLFIQANNALGFGNGVPFRDGLLCIGGSYVGLQFIRANTAGVAKTTVDINSVGGGFAGDLKRFQAYYQNPISSVCGTNWNLTNGLELTWVP